MAPAEILIIGAGSFGTAVAMTLARSQKSVSLYCRTAEQAELIGHTRENPRYFPGYRLHDRIRTISELHVTADTKVVFLAFPAKEIDYYAKVLGDIVAEGTLIINLVKGLHDFDFTFAELFERLAPHAHYVALKGPTFARPLFLAEWSGMTCGTRSSTARQKVEALFRGTHVHLDFCLSAHAVDAVSGIKNVYAIILGLASSIGLSDNTRFLLVSLILKELSVVLRQLGYDLDALLTYSGLGDTLLTGFCDASRNRTFGVMIGKEIAIDTSRSGFLVEGVRSVAILHRRIDPKYTPLLNALLAIMNQQKPPLSILDVISGGHAVAI